MKIFDQLQNITRKKKAENSHLADSNMQLSAVYNLSAFFFSFLKMPVLSVHAQV